MNTVLIIGARTGQPLSLSDTAKYGYSHVRVCRNRDELYKAVIEVSNGAPIDTLDIFDHGADGAVAIGDEILVNFGDVNVKPDVSFFEQIQDRLSPRAHVRFLGCRTAEGLAGRRLLVKVQSVLGCDRLVFGALDRTRPEHFGETGYLLADELLYSSLAAIDLEGPSVPTRTFNLLTFRNPLVNDGA